MRRYFATNLFNNKWNGHVVTGTIAHFHAPSAQPRLRPGQNFIATSTLTLARNRSNARFPDVADYS